MTPDRLLSRRIAWPLGLAIAALSAALPAQAQYKVVGADGKVTYTDRPPASAEGRVTSLTQRGGSALPEAAMPLELRQPVARYPVTLYVVTGSCDPCDSARQLLRQRGVPYTEKQVQTPEDSEALARLTGGRDAPTLMVGSQTLRGFSPDVWVSYLDAAGYPRDSRLPAAYSYPPATPIVERREASAARAPAARASQPGLNETPLASPSPAPASPVNIRF
jgi:glutaredoxin